MMYALRRGQRVRITPQNRMPRYKTGDEGMIAEGPHALGERDGYYLVVMDKDDPPRLVIFTEDEIAPD